MGDARDRQCPPAMRHRDLKARGPARSNGDDAARAGAGATARPSRSEQQNRRNIMEVAWRGQVSRIGRNRSEEHTSELQSLMRISYAVFCLKKKQISTTNTHTNIDNCEQI